MSFNNNLINLTDIISNFIGSMLQWIVAGVITLAYLQSRKKLFPIIYKFFGQRIAEYFQKAINFIVDPRLRMVIIASLLTYLHFNHPSIGLSTAIFLLSLSLLWKPKTKISFDPLPTFSDDFSNKKHTEKNWLAKTHKLEIENNFGKPAPDLGLRFISTEATNTFLYLKDIEIEEGTVECDVYLEPGAVFNLVFLANISKHNWYMARLDTRERNSDGLLIKDKGPGNNWREHAMSGTRRKAKEWTRVRLEFGERKARLYANNEMLVEAKIETTSAFGKKIGLFNELADAHIDNFALY